MHAVRYAFARLSSGFVAWQRGDIHHPTALRGAWWLA